MSPDGFSSLLQTHSVILGGSLAALCFHLFTHNKQTEKTAIVRLVRIPSSRRRSLRLCLMRCPRGGRSPPCSVSRGALAKALPGKCRLWLWQHRSLWLGGGDGEDAASGAGPRWAPQCRAGGASAAGLRRRLEAGPAKESIP